MLTNAANLRLLVVDRTPALDDALRLIADELGVDMTICPSLTDAFVELKRIQPHVALIDADLCDHLGGVGAVRAVRVLAPQCEAILLSIDPASPYGLEAIRAGALECVATASRALARLPGILLRVRSGLQRAAHALHEFEQALGYERWAPTDSHEAQRPFTVHS